MEENVRLMEDSAEESPSKESTFNWRMDESMAYEERIDENQSPECSLNVFAEAAEQGGQIASLWQSMHEQRLLQQSLHEQHLQRLDLRYEELEERVIEAVHMSINQEMRECLAKYFLSRGEMQQCLAQNSAQRQGNGLQHQASDNHQKNTALEKVLPSPEFSCKEKQVFDQDEVVEDSKKQERYEESKSNGVARDSKKQEQYEESKSNGVVFPVVQQGLAEEQPQNNNLRRVTSEESELASSKKDKKPSLAQVKSKVIAKQAWSNTIKSSRDAEEHVKEVKDLESQIKGVRGSLKQSKTIATLDIKKTVVKEPGIRARVAQAIQSTYAESVMLIIIFSNTAYMAWETDWVARHLQDTETSMPWVRGLELFFTWIFTADLASRIFVERMSFLKGGKNVYWNLLDSLVVGCGLLEEVMRALSSGSSAVSSTKVMRVLRILRIIRILRFIKGASFFTELRAICMGIWHTIGSLVWAIVLFLMIIFVFSVYLTRGASLYLMDNRNVDEGFQFTVRSNFGSLFLTMYSLWKAISGGADWEEYGDALFVISPDQGAIFLIYIAFAICAMFNVVTGIFVNKAVKVIEGDVDLKLLDHNSSRNEHIEAVKRVFEKADTNLDGTLNREEFTEHFDNPCVQAFFASLDLDLEGIGANQLFDLLNFDKDHVITCNEFIFGCSTMKGYARNLDLARLSSTVWKNHLEIRNLLEHALNIDSPDCPGVTPHGANMLTNMVPSAKNSRDILC